MDHEDSHVSPSAQRFQPAEPAFALASRPHGLPLLPAMGRPMTRCECAEVDFDDVAQAVDDGDALQDVAARTGCGQNCTGCVDDLLRHLAARRVCRH